MPTALAHRGPNTVRLAKRFFWKECRRIGVLAALMFVFATLTMLFVNSFASRRLDVDSLLTVIAVGAGMMLAVAAAATIFSVEKEEGTAELLERLPRNAAAMTLGKLASAAIVVPLCTVALLMLAWTMGSEAPPPQRIINEALPQVSLFLLEAFVWSLVASLACANPLIAAVLGIALASASVQLGIIIANPSSRGFTTDGLNAAAPARLALAGIGALVAGWLVTRWPTPPRRRPRAVAADLDTPSRKWLRWPQLRLGLFARLFWQTVRQSWATAIVATLLGLFLTFMSILIPQGLFEIDHDWGFVIGFGLLFAPAMMGAVVFRADQRRDAYRFLAEHAGRPRMLWLARNTAGIAMLAAFLLLLAAVVAGVWWYLAANYPGRINFDWQDRSSAGIESLRVMQGFGLLRQIALVAGAAVLIAYAFGQFFSLALRSDVLAAMLALIASTAVLAWACVVGAWGLPPMAFLLPLAIGALIASLLRVRDWMFDRRGVWRWAPPILVLTAPLAWFAWATPLERLRQVDVPTPHIRSGNLVIMYQKEQLTDEPLQVGSWNVTSGTRFDELVSQTQEELRLGREVADAYERLETKVVSYEVINSEAASADETVFSVGDVDPSEGTRVSVARLANGRFEGEAFDEFIRLSRIKCRLAPSPAGSRSHTAALQAAALIDWPDDKAPFLLDRRMECLLASRRISIQGANSGSLRDQYYSGYLAEEFVEWATAEGQTATRLAKAIWGLRETETMMVGPIGFLMNDRLEAQMMLSGELSWLQQLEQIREPQADEWLAFLSHEAFGFEQQRALKALDLLAAYDAAFLGEGMRALMSNKPSRHWLQYYSIDDAQLVAALEPDVPRRGAYYFDDLATLASARSSSLASMVFDHRRELPEALRNWMAGVAWRRAERVRLALIAYRLENDEYPTSLDALVGVFLGSEEIRDPYTGEPFGWATKGFELPVSYFNEEPAEFVKSSAPIGTPMLWCGGSALAVPTKIGRGGKRDEGDETPANRPTETVMYLQPSEEIHFWPMGKFWMPLPK
jgi:hypothetical protein